jgi:hypothetical protein
LTEKCTDIIGSLVKDAQKAECFKPVKEMCRQKPMNSVFVLNSTITLDQMVYPVYARISKISREVFSHLIRVKLCG